MTEVMLIFKQMFCIEKIIVDFETNSSYNVQGG